MESASRASHSVCRPDWHTKMGTRNVAGKRSCGTEQQQWGPFLCSGHLCCSPGLMARGFCVACRGHGRPPRPCLYYGCSTLGNDSSTKARGAARGAIEALSMAVDGGRSPVDRTVAASCLLSSGETSVFSGLTGRPACLLRRVLPVGAHRALCTRCAKSRLFSTRFPG